MEAVVYDLSKSGCLRRSVPELEIWEELRCILLPPSDHEYLRYSDIEIYLFH